MPRDRPVRQLHRSVSRDMGQHHLVRWRCKGFPSDRPRRQLSEVQRCQPRLVRERRSMGHEHRRVDRGHLQEACLSSEDRRRTRMTVVMLPLEQLSGTMSIGRIVLQQQVARQRVVVPFGSFLNSGKPFAVTTAQSTSICRRKPALRKRHPMHHRILQRLLRGRSRMYVSREPVIVLMQFCVPSGRPRPRSREEVCV
jgi:hypothetical protein